MPVLIISILLTILGITFYSFWGWIASNANILSTVATAFAFFAAAWNAHEARRSSKAAGDSIKNAKESLEASRMSSAIENFNSHFSLLLEQHNISHQKLCEYLDTPEGIKFTNNLIERQEKPLTKLSSSCRQLYTHSIISPYMRVLYHIFKFVNENYYGQKDDVQGRKKYTSLARSLIRNDVLCLIALNSADAGAPDNNEDYGFKTYQYYLHKYNFFEHANFISWRNEKNFDDSKDKVRDIFDDWLRNGALKFIKTSAENAIDNKIEIFNADGSALLPIKIILIFIYSNPFNDLLKSHIKKTQAIIEVMFEKVLDANEEAYNKALQELEFIIGSTCHTPEESRVIKDSLELQSFLNEYISNSGDIMGYGLNKISFDTSYGWQRPGLELSLRFESFVQSYYLEKFRSSKKFEESKQKILDEAKDILKKELSLYDRFIVQQ